MTNNILTPKDTKNLATKFDNTYLSTEKKIEKIEAHMKEILLILGIDLRDPSIKDTPKRIAKMYVDEFFYGLSSDNFPKLTFIPINDHHIKDQMILTKDILVQSICEHHFLPMIGKAHIAYIPNDKIIGLSKINRIVEYLSRRPQLQEKLTHQICKSISNLLNTEDVAVYLELTHFCMQFRGVKDQGCKTITSDFSGRFKSNNSFKNEFFIKITGK
jgi:GTP cyclohydrolase IA